MLNSDVLFIGVSTLFLSIDLVTPDCGVITKKQWAGLTPTQVEYLPRPVDLVIIQHTVTPVCETDRSCEERVANIQSYQMDQLHFSDIGANFLVGGNGKVYEGSGWLHVGAHTVGYNRKSIGIMFIGNFNNDDPKPQALEAVKNLLNCGVTEGHLTPDFKVVAHRQLVSTESPGRKLYQAIRSRSQWIQDVSTIKN